MRLSRRGFTLAEMLIAMVVTGIVGLALSRLLTSSQRIATTQVETALMQSMMRQGSSVLSSELQEIGTDSAGMTDIIAMTDSTLSYRSMGVVGMACLVSTTEVRVLRSTMLGSSGIVATRDSLLLFVENNVSASSDDEWLPLPITSVTNSTCSGAAAVALATTIPAADVAATITEAPVRIYVPMQFGVVASGGKRYLGLQQLRPSGAAMQPLAGPVAGQGVRFTYMDSTAAVTTLPTRVRLIRMAVYGQTDRAVRASPGVGTVAVDTDSLVTFITLRNTPRP